MCIFCRIASGQAPCRRVFEDEWTMSFMDTAGDVDGHMLVIPKRHVSSLLDCDEETLLRVMATVKRIVCRCVEDCGYDGANLLHASGESAGQSVSHFHIHVIPRRDGDGVDAWPAFAGAAQDADAVYKTLKAINDR